MWALAIEVLLLSAFFVVARNAGPHSPAVWFGVVSQYPAVAIMSRVMANEAAGGPGAMVAYYSGLVVIQTLLWSVVLYFCLSPRTDRRERA